MLDTLIYIALGIILSSFLFFVLFIKYYVISKTRKKDDKYKPGRYIDNEEEE